MSNLTIEILEQLDPPEHCPFTGLPFFMWIEHHATKKWVPTYGGPNDSYTIPKKDENGCFVRERYDHDFGGWVVGEVEDVGMQVVDDQSIVLEPSHPSYDWLSDMKACNTQPKVLGWLRAADDDEHMLDPLFFLGELKPTIVTDGRKPSNYVPVVALGDSADTHMLNWLRENTCDLRCIEIQGFDDSDVDWVVIEHHMAEPHEREIGRSYSDDPRGAIRAAMAAAAAKREPGQ